MEEPKKLIYDSGEQPEEVFLRVERLLGQRPPVCRGFTR